MCERTKDDFTTVNQKTYTRKSGFRPDKAVHEPDYKDILAGPFTEYVVPNFTAQPEHPYEDVHHCYERLMKSNPKIKRFLDEEPNHEVIATDLLNRSRTVYQVDYCNIENGFESSKSRARKRVSLPPDWGEIPSTTQQASFRPPTRLATWDLRMHPTRPPLSALQPNLKERAILQIQTGVSEYEAKIGVLGDMILEDHLHGTHEDSVQCLKYQQMLQAPSRK